MAAAELSVQLLADRLVATVAPAGMKAGFDPGDIGAGMVVAPQV